MCVHAHVCVCVCVCVPPQSMKNQPPCYDCWPVSMHRIADEGKIDADEALGAWHVDWPSIVHQNLLSCVSSLCVCYPPFYKPLCCHLKRLESFNPRWSPEIGKGMNIKPAHIPSVSTLSQIDEECWGTSKSSALHSHDLNQDKVQAVYVVCVVCLHVRSVVCGVWYLYNCNITMLIFFQIVMKQCTWLGVCSQLSFARWTTYIFNRLAKVSFLTSKQNWLGTIQWNLSYLISSQPDYQNGCSIWVVTVYFFTASW